MKTNGSFLRDDAKNWASSSLFFMSLVKLGVNVDKYYIPIGVSCSNAQLIYYADILLDEVARLEFKEEPSMGREEFKAHRDYIRKIAFILRGWGKEGHGVKVI